MADSADELVHVLGLLRTPPQDKDVVRRALDQFRADVMKTDTSDGRLAAYHSALVLLHEGVSEATYAMVVTRLRGFATAQMRREAVALFE